MSMGPVRWLMEMARRARRAIVLPPLWILRRRLARQLRGVLANSSVPLTEPFNPKRILIVTDAWRPQVNGVVRSLESLQDALQGLGHDVRMITPEGFRTVAMPTYPEIRLALFPYNKVADAIERFDPDALHIATEGPLGLAARRYCVRHGVRFSTAFHTRYPDYIYARFRLPRAITYAWLRWFHRPSVNVMAPTQSEKRDLETRGFERVQVWSRGVDLSRYDPAHAAHVDHPRPIWINVGRLAVEKNLDAFLALDLPGTKIIVGGGPLESALKAKFPQAVFTGPKFGKELSALYASSDVFVFPSRTDTFGLVLLEALASGLPVAAYPVQGPLDVIGTAPVGVLDEDLGAACRRALTIPRPLCRAFAQNYTWPASARQFLGLLAIPDFDPMEQGAHVHGPAQAAAEAKSA